MNTYRNRFEALSKELAEVKESLFKAEAKNNKEIQAFGNQMAHIVYEIKQAEKLRSTKKQEFNLQKGVYEPLLKELREQLKGETYSLDWAQKKNEEAKQQLEYLRMLLNSPLKAPQPKRNLYLATEKLVEVKRENVRSREDKKRQVTSTLNKQELSKTNNSNNRL